MCCTVLFCIALVVFCSVFFLLDAVEFAFLHLLVGNGLPLSPEKALMCSVVYYVMLCCSIVFLSMLI